MTDWLISLYPRHADAVLDGSKLYELRRSAPPKSLRPDDVVYIYATVPTAAIVGRFRVVSVLNAHPDEVWRRVCAHVPTSTHADWLAYVGPRPAAWAFQITAAERVAPVPLPAMRARRVHPPQGWVRYFHHDNTLSASR